ncbi:MAG: hypothetical protein HRU40_16520, partial [Saprospiraceae bacterium]|nr:hypothetical protein [Saprospiraceae bacterium]
MKLRIFSIVIASWMVLPLWGQRESITPALQSFLQTDFMQQYQDIRIKAEAQVRTFNQ